MMKFERADTGFSRFKGMMLTRKKKNLLLDFKREGIMTSAIHTFFMLYTIDAVWLDSDMEVVDVKKNLKPFSFQIFKPRIPARYVLELGRDRL